MICWKLRLSLCFNHVSSNITVATQRRVEWFTGKMLVKFLMKKKHPALPPIADKAAAMELCKRLIRGQFFHRSERVVTHQKRLLTLKLHSTQPFNFSEGGIFTWVYQGSKRKIYMYSALMMFGLLMMCLIKVWPLWLKIAVYWCSLVLLITQLSLIAIRLVAYVLCWLVGLRGYWILPNMFNDDLEIYEAFTPLFGKGLPIMEVNDEEEINSMYYNEDEDDDDEEELLAAKMTEAKSAEKNDAAGEAEAYDFDFGWVNLLVIFLLGVGACYYMGVFSGENIPDFVVSQRELYSRYPSLAPPDDSYLDRIINETELAEMEAKKLEEVQQEIKREEEEREKEMEDEEEDKSYLDNLYEEDGMEVDMDSEGGEGEDGSEKDEL